MHIAKNGWVSNSKKGLNVTDFINTFAIKGILWLSIFNLIMYDFLWSAGPEWYCLSWVMAGLLFSLGWFIEFPPPPVRYIFRSMGEGGGIFPLIPEPFWQLGNPIDTFLVFHPARESRIIGNKVFSSSQHECYNDSLHTFY